MSEHDFFECRCCGYCCQGETTVSLDEEDFKRLCRHLQLPRAEVMERYLRLSGENNDIVQMQTVNGYCIFYDHATGCTIHQGKPWRCRQWPLHPSMLDDPANYEVIRNSCPGFKTGLSHDEFCRAMGATGGGKDN